MSQAHEPGRLKDLAVLFLKLGFTGFGGPAAHLAMMEDEVVARRQWLTRERFLDLMGITNLIPGPNSTEMALYLGHARAGWGGLVVAGLGFILPAVLITVLLAWGYARFGALPQVAPLLQGVQPVVVALIAGALCRLGRTAFKDWRLALVAVGVASVAFRQGHEVLALFGGGLLGMMWKRMKNPGAGAALGLSSVAQAASLAATPVAPAGLSLWKLGFFFLKIGAVLYGSGYVLFAFLEGGLVRGYEVLAQEQLLDAIAVGQFTPGPVLSTATFIGYLIAGPAGAAVATAGIFLPSFLFVALSNPLIPRLRDSAWMAAFLDAVNASALGLMASVVVKLGQAALLAPPAWGIAGGALLVSLRWRGSGAYLILAGALIGYLTAL